jgi:Family of unknown function (DUF6308)
MGLSIPEVVQVGGVPIPFAKAKDWVTKYTAAENVSAKRPYAYPAYDLYEGGRNDPWHLSDADFLAPVLLNVPMKIRSYYGLQKIRTALEAGLANEDLALPLADIDDPVRVAAMVKPLYAVLDDPQRKPWNVKVTTLSKVLHRKRPESLVLHDTWVQACYFGSGRTLAFDKNRSWADYMVALTLAIGHDIRTQRKAFELLDRATSSPGQLTHVRILDIVAWKSKGVAPSEATDGS